MLTGPNPYATPLELEDVDLAAAVRDGRLNKRQLIYAALVAHGVPMTIEAMAAWVAEVRGEALDEALVRSMNKAWGSTGSLYKQADGTLALDVQHHDARFFPVVVGTPRYSPPPELPVPTQPASDVRLLEEEVRAAFAEADLMRWSQERLAAVITDAVGEPLAPEAIEAVLADVGARHPRIARPFRVSSTPSYVQVLEDGRVVADPDHPGLPALRDEVRKRVAAGLLRKEQRRRSEAAVLKMRTERIIESAKALTVRRLLLHRLPAAKGASVFGALDPLVREGPVVTGSVESLRERAAAADTLVGVGIDALVEALGLERGRRRLVELAPRQKTRSRGKGQAPIRLSLPLLVRNTLGGWASLASASDLRNAARTADPGALHRLLVRDLDMLGAYYRYGMWHGEVFADFERYDSNIVVTFAESGDESMRAFLLARRFHEVVLTARGDRMRDPPRVLVGTIYQVDWHHVHVSPDDGSVVLCPLAEILDVADWKEEEG